MRTQSNNSHGPSLPANTDGSAPGLVASAFLVGIRGYQVLVRACFPPSCRFAPSCSEYARDAIRTRGAVRGALLTARRISRCHPWHPGGYDPVPVRKG